MVKIMVTMIKGDTDNVNDVDDDGGGDDDDDDDDDACGSGTGHDKDNGNYDKR